MEIPTQSGPLSAGGQLAPAPVVTPPAAAAAVPATQPLQPPAPATPHSNKKIIFFGSIGAVVLLAALGGGYYWWSHRPYTEAQVIALIREGVIPSVVQVRCATEEGGPESQGGTGLYYVDQYDQSPWVETNAHVVLGGDGLYHGCNVYFPNPVDGSFYQSVYRASQPLLYNNLEARIGDTAVNGLDYAALPLVQDASSTYPFPPAQASIYDAVSSVCNRSAFAGKDIVIGDPVYILGYPGTGEESVTLTDGVVSGFTGEFNQWIKTSAAVNHGNSGGIAIGKATGCQFGIVSAATFDRGSNLGYVLSSSYISTFLNSLTGSTTYMVPDLSADDADPAAYLNRTYDYPGLGFTIDVPDGWAVSMGEESEDGSVPTYIESPSEGILDMYADNMTVYQYATSTERDLAYAIKQAGDLARELDPDHLVEKYITLDGVRTYQVLFKDASLQNYDTPMSGYIIIFRYKGQLYELISRAEDGAHGYDYLMLFAGMGDSIHFK